MIDKRVFVNLANRIMMYPILMEEIDELNNKVGSVKFHMHYVDIIMIRGYQINRIIYHLEKMDNLYSIFLILKISIGCGYIGLIILQMPHI